MITTPQRNVERKFKYKYMPAIAIAAAATSCRHHVAVLRTLCVPISLYGSLLCVRTFQHAITTQFLPFRKVRIYTF